MKRYSIRKFLENPVENSDEFFGFYDWFCRDDSLQKRMLSIVPKIKFLVKMGVINQDTNYVWFKNNCPVNGSTYDDFRISTLDEDRDFLGGFCPRTGHKVQDKCSVWYFDAGRNLVEESFKDWNSFKKEVKENESFRENLKRHFG